MTLAVAMLGWAGLVSLITFVVFAWDKRASRRGGWRVSERTLLGWSLLGGWPGGWLAMRRLRHKSVKRSFRWRFFVMAGLNVIVVLGALIVLGVGVGTHGR